MSQTSLEFDRVTFSPEMAELVKAQGMERAAKNRAELLAEVQLAMRVLARTRSGRTATADDAQRYLIGQGLNSTALGNAAGSIFKPEFWECIGFVKSERVSRAGGINRIWRLR